MSQDAAEPCVKRRKRQLPELRFLLVNFFPHVLCSLIVDYVESAVIRDTRKTIRIVPTAWLHTQIRSCLHQEESILPYILARAPISYPLNPDGVLHCLQYEKSIVSTSETSISHLNSKPVRDLKQAFVPFERVEGRREHGVCFGDGSLVVYELGNHMTMEGTVVSESPWTEPGDVTQAACFYDESRNIFHVAVMTERGLHWGHSGPDGWIWHAKNWKDLHLMPLFTSHEQSMV